MRSFPGIGPDMEKPRDMSKKILLIEDDTVLRENTAELLELSGYDVFTAPDGRKGIEAAWESMPDAILCDIMMPEIDGYGVLEALSKDEQTRKIPFIFLTAKTERKDVRKGMELGADDYLTKPFEEKELIGAIESRIAKMAILDELSREGGAKPEDLWSSPRNLHELKNFIDDEGTEQEFAAGESIYKEGDNSNLMFLVLKGVVKTHKLDEQGKELITGVHNADDFFGLTSFSKNIPYSEFATAMEPTKLAGIAKEEVKKVLNANYALTLELMQYLSDSLSEAKEQLLQMAYGSVRRKTASTILKFVEKLPENSSGQLHILRSDLASVAGIATETLIRTLSNFKDEGLIAIDNRDIRILRMGALKNIK